MKQTLNDFGDLKDLRKKMEEQEQKNAAGAQPAVQPRPSARPGVSGGNRAVAPSGLQHALLTGMPDLGQPRKADIAKGTRVRLMDSRDTGTVTGVRKGCYEIEVDGFVMQAARSEFVVVDEAEDRKMYAAVKAAPKHRAVKKAPAGPAGDLVVDLHLERIPGGSGVPAWTALEYQMNWFRKTLRENLKYRGRRIIFIHGDGDGTLRSAVRKELDEVFAMSCTYTYGTTPQYGTGATVVTVR